MGRNHGVIAPPAKCNIAKAKFCWAIGDAAEFNNPDKKTGLNITGLYRAVDGRRGTGMSLRGTRMGNVLANFCPFCGASVRNRYGGKKK